MIKRFPVLITISIVVSLFVSVLAIASVSYQTSISGAVPLGRVDVAIDSKLAKDSYVPGEMVVATVTLQNLGENAWVRVKPIQENSNFELDSISCVSQGWSSGDDDWWYCDTPLKAGATIKLEFDSVISSSLSNGGVESDITFRVEAIQASNIAFSETTELFQDVNVSSLLGEDVTL